MNQLASMVRERRKDMALSQDQLAEELGVTRTTLSNLENGSPVGAKTLRALSKKFGISTRLLRKMMLNEDNK